MEIWIYLVQISFKESEKNLIRLLVHFICNIIILIILLTAKEFDWISAKILTLVSLFNIIVTENLKLNRTNHLNILL